MRKFPIIIYLFPFLLLLIVVALLQGHSNLSENGKKSNKKPQEIDNPDELTFPSIIVDMTNDGSQTESRVLSRIPIYPNSHKLALDKDMDVNQAVFYSTSDPIDEVKNWYIESLGGLTKVNMIDIQGTDDLRKVTVSMPDEPRELVEIKEHFKGSKELMITITTIEFYTRSQPKAYKPEASDDSKSSNDEPADTANQKKQEKEMKDD